MWFCLKRSEKKKKNPARQIIRILTHVQGREPAERSEERAEKEWKFQQGNAKKGNGYSGYGNPQKNAERQNPAIIRYRAKYYFSIFVGILCCMNLAFPKMQPVHCVLLTVPFW